MTNAVIRKVLAAVAAVSITMTGALAATVHTTTVKANVSVSVAAVAR